MSTQISLKAGADEACYVTPDPADHGYGSALYLGPTDASIDMDIG